MLTSLAKSVLDTISDDESKQQQNNDESKQQQNNDESKQEQNNDESKQEQNNDESKQQQNNDESKQQQNNDESKQQQNNDESKQQQNNDESKQEQNNDESKQEQNNDESKQEQNNDESKQDIDEQNQLRTGVDTNINTDDTRRVQDDSELIITSSQSQIERKRYLNNTIFNKAILHKEVVLDISEIGQNIDSILLSKLTSIIEGKCILEGYIKPDSSKILTYSTGLLNGSKIIYQVVIECLICKPYEGMVIDCIVKNITQTAGIRAELNNNPSPMVIYLARDHHLGRADFTAIKINDKIKIKVIGERYELNDTYVSVIGELMRKRLTKQPILRIRE